VNSAPRFKSWFEGVVFLARLPLLWTKEPVRCVPSAICLALTSHFHEMPALFSELVHDSLLSSTSSAVQSMERITLATSVHYRFPSPGRPPGTILAKAGLNFFLRFGTFLLRFLSFVGRLVFGQVDLAASSWVSFVALWLNSSPDILP
jgi:hypothetical protein